MDNSEGEPYSTIFASLKHPVRRKILRMLSEKPRSFSDMLETLGVTSSYLTYHLENLGELVCKTDGGKYKLSTFGEAAIVTMSRVEDIPKTTSHLSGEASGSSLARARNVAIALGMTCIILAVGLVGALVYYLPMINDKNNTISSLNSQISQLNSTITNLQKQLASDNSTVKSINEPFGLQLTMKLQKTEYSVGEPINMKLTITNISNQTTTFVLSWAIDFDFRVYNGTNTVLYINGQPTNVLLYTTIYQLSDRWTDTAHPEVVQFVTLNAGESLSQNLSWQQTNDGGVPVSPGTYYVIGRIGGPSYSMIETTPMQITIAEPA